VAAQTIERGGKVAAIVDLADAAEWTRVLRATAGQPDLRAQSRRWRRTIRKAGTPWLDRRQLIRVEPAGEGLRATLAPCDAAGRRVDAPSTTVSTDCVVVGHGSIPATEITGLLHARHRYSREAGGWVAVADELGRTSRAWLYVAGDVSGSAGADAAATHGTLVGLACALDLDAAPDSDLRSRIDVARRLHQRSSGLRSALENLTARWSAQVDGIAANTIVCRCEEVSRAELDAACDAGARDMNQLKAWTRCGMGSCQGRLCGDIAGELLMQRVGAGSREVVGRFTVRLPLRPVTLAALTGSFDYNDIPIPAAAPL
jgi:bacterioferritin-associated ferredoxin